MLLTSKGSMLRKVVTALCIVAVLCFVDATPRIRVSQPAPTTQRDKGAQVEDCCYSYPALLQYFADLSNQANQLANAADALKIRIAEIQRMMPQSCETRRTRPTTPPIQEKGIPVRGRPATWVPEPKSRRPEPSTRHLAQTSHSYPRSCREWFQRNGPARNGEMFAIDPYGRGPILYVRCIFYTDYVMTEFGPSYHAQKNQYRAEGQSCYNRYDSIQGNDDICKQRDIDYGSLNRNDLHTIMTLSGTCSQSVVWDCHANRLLYLAGGRHTTVYGVTLSGREEDLMQGVCACHESRNCTDPSQSCHCSSKLDQWSSDDIIVYGGENNENLPITKVTVGDIAGRREAARVVVGPVTCVQKLELDSADSQGIQDGDSSINQPEHESEPDTDAETEVEKKPESTPHAPVILVATPPLA